MVHILFVCTGNICRSPTAEALARLELGDRVRFGSAGLAALDDAPASELAVAAAGEIGADLSGHRAASVTRQSAGEADRIYVMTRRQRHQLLSLGTELEYKIALLDPSGADIPDPYGQGIEVYRRSRDLIARAIGERMPEWRRLAD